MSEQDNNPKDSFEDPFMTRLGVLFEYVDQTQNNLSALFVALVEEEDVSASDEGEADNLANADTVTQQGQLGFSQGIAGIQYQDTLAAAGLAFNPDVFSGGLQVADGEKFVQTLRAMPTGNETLQKGLNSILSSFLWRTAYAYVPDRDEMLRNTYEQYCFRPQVIPAEVSPPPSLEILLNMGDVVPELERLETSKRAMRSLEALHTANLENMTPEWAIAHYWGLFTPPATHWGDSEWTQWHEPRHWNAFFEYLEGARVKAPGDSKFMTLVVEGMLQNIGDLRNGVLEPTEIPQPPVTTEFDDDEYIIFHDSDEAEEALAAEEARQYDELLAGVAARLRMMQA